MSESQSPFSAPKSELIVDQPAVLSDQNFALTQEEFDKLKKIRFWSRTFILPAVTFCFFMVPAVLFAAKQSPEFRDQGLAGAVVGLIFISMVLAVPGALILVFSFSLTKYLKTGTLEAFVKSCQWQNWVWGVVFFALFFGLVYSLLVFLVAGAAILAAGGV